MAAGRRKFGWEAVSGRVIKGMLIQAYESASQVDEATAVGRLSKKDALVSQARRTLGTPPGRKYFDASMVDWLRRHWLPTAPEDVVLELTQMVQAGLRGAERRRTFRSSSGRVKFLQQRNITTGFTTNFRRAFLKAHWVPGTAVGSTPGKSGRTSSIPLVGKGAQARPLYDHQAEALEAFRRAPSPVTGLVVLPTGAGKTDVAVTWLLEELAADPTARVLWVAHQQELVDQSLRTFQSLATTMPEGFSRRARAIHSAASAPSVLSDPDLDVAGTTVQTLSRFVNSRPAVVRKFLQRPTYVVVDEAHHAGSPTYSDLLRWIQHHSDLRALLGLSATPYPTSPTARAELATFFPDVLIEARREELIARGVLARPELHVINTGLRVLLSLTERNQAAAADLPPSVLGRLVTADRNALLVRIWRREQERWGKTLVFVTSISHADELTDLFRKADVDARAVHSQSTEGRAAQLGWFRDSTKPCVLVSVGMLTEGVDLPDARTAFLARPTTSRILMQQMIGRVLRGPSSGGDAIAHLVYMRDRWANFSDVIEPGEVVATGPPEPPGRSDGERLPPVIVDDGGEVIPPEVAATVERLIRMAGESALLDDDDPVNDRSLDPLLSASRLVGYFELDSWLVPVFEHQRAGFTELIEAAVGPRKGSGFLTHFDDQPPPYPSRRALRAIVDHTREFGPPPFVDLEAEIGPSAAARAVISAGSITAEERVRLVRERFASGINRSVFPTFEHFEQAVDAEVRALLSRRRWLDAERRPVTQALGTRVLPRRERALPPLVAQTVEQARARLPTEHSVRLDDPPPVFWTKRVVGSTWGHWSIALGRKGAGRQQIRINRLLRTTPSAFPDEALCYLIFHELLHHLLPGQGHDAAFRELEREWPDADELDRLFDTLHETWDVRPERYVRDVGGPRDSV